MTQQNANAMAYFVVSRFVMLPSYKFEYIAIGPLGHRDFWKGRHKYLQNL